MVDATVLNFDATFKVPAKYVSSEGDLGTKKSLGTASNEFNEIVDQTPIAGIKNSSDGLHGDIGSVSSMWKSINKRAKDWTIHLFNTDNCCGPSGDKVQIQREFPFLEDITSEPLVSALPGVASLLPTDADIRVLKTKESAHAFCQELLDAKPAGVGLDTEWYFRGGVGGKGRGKVALVQIAYTTGNAKRIGLLHLSSFNKGQYSLPTTFLQLCYSRDVQKLGVSVTEDIRKLSVDYNLDFKQCRAIVDLEHFMVSQTKKTRKSAKSGRSVKWGVATLLSEVMGVEYEKDETVRMSNWELSLTQSQIQYAAEDAWISLALEGAIRVYAQSYEDAGSLGFGGGGDGDDYGGDDTNDSNEMEHSDSEAATAGNSQAAVASWTAAEERTDDARVDFAKLIKQHGLELKSDWLENPPVRDNAFLEKLQTAKDGGFLVSRVKNDPFHWMQRYGNNGLSKTHLLFPLFMACMRDAIFHLHQPDVDAFKAHLVATGKYDEDGVRQLPKAYFTKRNRCRRSIPSRLELAVRIQSVFELFVGLTDQDGVPLITDKVVKQHHRNMKHVWAGCLSDIPGLVMYYDCRKSKRSAPCYTTLRGTSQLEAYHRWLRACIQGSQLSKEHFKLLLAHFNFRWNTRCGIRNRGRTDYGTYSHWIIEEIIDICGENIDAEVFGDFEPAVKAVDLQRIGVDVGEIGLHATTIELGEGEGPGDDGNDEEHDACLFDDMFGDIEGDDEGDGEDSDDEGDGEVGGSSRSNWNCNELAPMRSLAEIKLFMKLVPNFTAGENKRGSGGEPTYAIEKVKFAAFSDKWNAYVDQRSASAEGAKQLQSLGIRKKSPAHLKQFLISTDEGLKLAWALAGVRERMIDLRRRLKLSTASDVQPAAQHGRYGDDEDGLDSCGACSDGGGCCSSDPLEKEKTDGVAAVGGEAPGKKKQRRGRTCQEPGCGSPAWQKGRRENTKLYCSNRSCTKYMEKQPVGSKRQTPTPASASTVPAAAKEVEGKSKKQKRARTCLACGCVTWQQGARKAMKHWCTSSVCERYLPKPAK